MTSDTEQDITNGIIKVVSGQQRKVYFTQGHGEQDTASAERDGYNAIADALGRENYTRRQARHRADRARCPDDAAVVVVAGPKIDFFPPEVDALKKYLDKPGKLLLELDPPDKADGPAADQPDRARARLGHPGRQQHRRGRQRHGPPDRHRRVGAGGGAAYPAHPITERFSYMTAFPLAREASPVSGGVNGHTAQPFIQTGPRSWAEADIKGLLTTGEVSLDESKGDKKGPITLGSAVTASAAPAAPPKPGEPEPPKPETRVVVFGDSDFAANAALGIQGNRDLFMNIVGWLSQQENLISIRPKEADDRRITMTATQQSNIMWLSLLIIPGFIFGAGVYTWWGGEARCAA